MQMLKRELRIGFVYGYVRFASSQLHLTVNYLPPSSTKRSISEQGVGYVTIFSIMSATVCPSAVTPLVCNDSVAEKSIVTNRTGSLCCNVYLTIRR